MRYIRFTILSLFIVLSVAPLSAQISINEIMASNDATVSDNNGEFDDWVEIYNAGSTSINIGGWYVSDDPANLKKFQIPNNRSSQTTISPGGYMILWFDDDTGQGPLHINHKLSADGESVIITASNGISRIDSVKFGEQTTDISYGRETDGSGSFTFLNPTPGSSNNNSALPEKSDTPEFSLESGFYSGQQAVGITAANGADIYYTTDGSVPTSSDNEYTAPVSISSSVVLRAVAVEQGKANSEVNTNTFLFEQEHSVPTVSFVMEPDSLFDYDKGMYAFGDSTEAENDYPYKGANFWQPWEYPVHLEYIDTNGDIEFEMDAGASIAGNFSRAFLKKSFIINNNEEYGIDRLEYELFPENDYDEYDGFGLRASAEERARLLNEMMYEINKKWNHRNAMQAYEWVALYINGEYWGTYNLIERKNDDFVESRYGYDDIDMIKDYDTVKDGEYTDYQEMLDVFNDNSLSEAEFYAYAKANIDFDSFTDHWIYQAFTSHGDENNLRYWRPRTPEGKWHYISYDFDWWRNLGRERSEYTSIFGRWSEKTVGGFWLIDRMLQNPTYREIYLNRLGDLMNTSFKQDYLNNLIDSLDAAIDPEMPRDIARWSDGWYDISGPTNFRMEYIPELTKDFLGEYIPYMYADFKSVYGNDTTRVTLASTSNGSIKLNSIEPNISNGSWSGVYFQDTSVRLKAQPEPGYKLKLWTVNGLSAGTQPVLTLPLSSEPVEIEAEFEEIENNQIVINEINYNPAQSFDSGDWVELYNHSESDIDLSGWTYQDEDAEPVFTFPANTVIESKGYAVISSDTVAFKSRHPGIAFVKTQAVFGLQGSGDQVRIYNEEGMLIDSLRYNDKAPWPVEADGLGKTLELIDWTTDNNVGESWAASLTDGGTPGRKNGTAVSAEEEEEEDELPESISLNQNYPNPFNPTTQITFNLPKAAEVNLTVYTMLGQKVQTLISNRLNAGDHSIRFDASGLSSGVYMYRLQSGNFVSTKKMILLK